MYERVKHLVIKEFIQSFRVKRTIFFLFVTPVIQILVFGYVATMDVENIPTALYDLDRSSESRELARRLESSGYFTIIRSPRSPGELRELIDRGKVLCALQINRDFGKDLRKGVPTEVQVIVDGTDSNTGLIAMGYINLITAQFGKAMLGPKVKTALSTIDVRPRVWYNPALRSRNYMLPGVIALILMLMCLILTSMSVVREREVGTMEQLMVTPIRPAELMLGKTIPTVIIAYFDTFLITAVGVFWFGVPIRGTLPLLALCTGAYLLSVLGIGLFISTISRTQQQALMAAFFFLMPAILLSGFVTPIENMPAVFRCITYASPLRYFLVIVRGIFLKGVGISVLWPQIAALLGIGVAILALSATRFKKRLG